jgi:glycerophosphoryl diester phosphodiesterase
MATAHPRLRALIAACLTLGLLVILLLVPDATRVYASNMLGSLRAPGQAAFVASHRGDQELAPENTLPAFRMAMASQVEFLETDIQLSSDNVPVLIHDATVDRTTNGTGRVAELTLAQLQRLDAGSSFSPAFAGTRIPTLDSFL